MVAIADSMPTWTDLIHLLPPYTSHCPIFSEHDHRYSGNVFDETDHNDLFSRDLQACDLGPRKEVMRPQISTIVFLVLTRFCSFQMKQNTSCLKDQPRAPSPAAMDCMTLESMKCVVGNWLSASTLSAAHFCISSMAHDNPTNVCTRRDPFGNEKRRQFRYCMRSTRISEVRRSYTLTSRVYIVVGAIMKPFKVSS